MSDGISRKRIEANRRNAQLSTGPRTEEGTAYEQILERWRREAGPDNVVEEHLIQRAAVLSVRLDRIERAHQEAREAAAREAVGRWYRRKQASARKLGQRLLLDPVNVIEELEATAFGCDWLIRHWRRLDSQIRLGSRWDGRDRAWAMAMLGLPGGPPDPEAGEDARMLWTLAVSVGHAQSGAYGPSALRPDPTADAFAPPVDPDAARAALRAVIARQIERLRALRDASWREVEGPERAAVARRAAAADTSQEGQLRHRYESAADRACMAAIRLFLNLRDRRRRELLAIAKEAAEIGETPRAPVGGGWWREVDSDPEPPGFVRIGAPEPMRRSEPDRAVAPDTGGDGPRGESPPSAAPSSTETSPERAADPAPRSSGAEDRNEAKPGPEERCSPSPKSRSQHQIRPNHPGGAAAFPERADTAPRALPTFRMRPDRTSNPGPNRLRASDPTG
ncbi:hypothetical protein [Tautonia sociabilis]|uniref:Uncharacterized protein n=1 Tax=Tautonia sociabilis TaxID=2080755 RepID=A0A432MKF7_9BACT|nr:hypothetical protein [Tautonia sociabilis]RUL87904.1 hypothetical protein TsocGM_10285 [Tautonia sociabilis]